MHLTQQFQSFSHGTKGRNIRDSRNPNHPSTSSVGPSPLKAHGSVMVVSPVNSLSFGFPLEAALTLLSSAFTEAGGARRMAWRPTPTCAMH